MSLLQQCLQGKQDGSSAMSIVKNLKACVIDTKLMHQKYAPLALSQKPEAFTAEPVKFPR